jgi:ATP phosphoribosyltransferase
LRNAHDRALLCRDEHNHVEFVYLRPRDIPQYVAYGSVDVGITGLDHALDREDQDPRLQVALTLGFGTRRCDSRGRRECSMTSAACTALASRRPFLGCCCHYLDGESVEATILRVHGASYDVAVTRIETCRL